MTIDEAIKRLEKMRGYAENDESALDDHALELGIEALKEVKKARDGDPALDGELLPGETEE